MPVNRPQPTLGFDTKAEAIIHLHGRGFPRATIAHDIGSTPDSVSSQLCKLGLKPNPAAVFRPSSQASFLEISPDLLPLLRPHAARRGLTCAALAALIVDTVVMAGLVDGVLDDRSDAPC